MVSIKDVADHAGVAISTVSKVLNHYPNVSVATQKKVNDAIEELGFVPNAVASALSSKQSGRIAILINQASQSQAIDEIDMRYLGGAIPKAKELGLDVVTLFFSMLKGKSVEEITAYLNSQSIKGLVIFGMSKDDIVLKHLVESGKFRCALIDVPLIGEHSSCIWVDQYKAQRNVAEKLLDENPAKSVLYIAGKDNGYVTEGRIKAIKDLCDERDLKLTIKRGNFSEKKAREITMEEGEAHDVIVCASDLCAIGAMRALIEMDIFRPVCGFDGINLMGYAGNEMLTVRQDFTQIAANAVCEVNRLLNGGEGREVIEPSKIMKICYHDILH